MRKVLRGLAVLFLAFGAARGEGEDRRITGVVSSAGGGPASGAVVRLFEQTLEGEVFGYRLLAETSADEDGSFELGYSADGLSPWAAEDGLLVISKEGFAARWYSVSLGRPREVSALLLPPLSLAGKVVDDAGAPVAGAEVRAVLCAWAEASPGTHATLMHYVAGCPELGAFTTRTDESGAFTIEDVPPDAFAEFVVVADGKATACTLRPGAKFGSWQPGARDIAITLVPGSTVEGRCLSGSDGSPVEGAVVVVAPREYSGNPFAASRTTTGVDGSFSVAGLAQGSYLIKVLPRVNESSPLAAQSCGVEVPTAGTAVPVGLALEEGGLAEVTVLDQETRKAMPSARVCLISGEAVSFWAATDVDGKASFRLPEGSYGLRTIARSGYETVVDDRSLEVETGQTIAADVLIEARPKIAGIVLDEEGKPAAHATILVSPGFWDTEFRTDAEGRFEIYPDEAVWFSGEAEEYSIVAADQPRGLAGVVETDGFRADCEVHLRKGVALTGKVVDPDGAPIPDATVQLSVGISGSPVSILGYASNTGPDGKYRLDCVADESEWDVEAFAAGFGTGSISVWLSEKAGETVEVDDIVLPKADKSVSGVVVDAAGKGVPGAEVYAWVANGLTASAETDSDGAFTINGLVDGAVNVDARTDDGYGSVEVNAGSQDVRIVVSRFLVAEGVEAPASLVGKPLPATPALPFETADRAACSGHLVCIIDTSQRVSRRFAADLETHLPDLAAKGVVVAAIDVSGQGQDAVSQWAEEAALTYQVISAGEDPQDVTRDWCAHALPWLVLADGNRLVEAEGFDVGEIEQKVAETVSK